MMRNKIDRDIEKSKLKNAIIRVDSKIYKPDFKNMKFNKTDLILDLRDYRYGYIIDIHENNKATIGEGFVSEVGVDIQNLVKLKSIFSKKILKRDKKTGILED